MTATALSETSPAAVTPHRRAHAGLSRLRWAVRAALTLGVAASVAANVLHADPNLISQLIAAWPPLALLLTVELISRVPAGRRALAVLRLLSTVVIAGIAAWVSYWHMVAVAARYGETGASPYLLPLSVDGLVIVASISLIELASRRTATKATMTTKQPHPSEVTTARFTSAETSPAAQAGAFNAVAPRTIGSTPDGSDAPLEGGAEGSPGEMPSPGDPAPHVRRSHDKGSHHPGDRTDGLRTAETTSDLAGLNPDSSHAPTNTAEAVAYWRRTQPSLHPAEIASRIHRSERTVRRHWPTALVEQPRSTTSTSA